MCKDISGFFFNESNIRVFYGRIFEVLAENEKRAVGEYNKLREHIGERIKSELHTNDTEAVLFFLSDGDLTKRNTLLKTKRRLVWDYYYLKRHQRMNELLSAVSLLRYLKENKKK